MSTEWMSCRQPPEPNVRVELRGSDYMGWWHLDGYWKPYKQPKKQKRAGRYCDWETGNALNGKEAPDEWRPKMTENREI